MGQKTDPRSLRLWTHREHDRVWYASKREYSKRFLEDQKLEEFITKEIYNAGVSRVIIKRRSKQIEIDVYTARPGLVIGKGGVDAEILRKKISQLAQKKVQLNVNEETNVSTCAVLLAQNVAQQLEKRIAFRRAMKSSITRALKSGALGIRVQVAGRLNGAEIARTEWYLEGRVPLHTFRANIDYGFTEANTTYGKIGVKVWVYKGDILDRKEVEVVSGPQDVELEEERENVNA